MGRPLKHPERHWTWEGDQTYTRMFGPLKCTICRKWGLTPEPTEYYAWLSCRGVDIGNTRFTLPISELGVPWHDDNADKIAQKHLTRAIKRHIREWLK
jgi:hypothetical protein